MKYILSVHFLFFLTSAFSQQKGVNPIANTEQNLQITRAVVIGISDYQNQEIPDLRFAHRDAEAFAQFLMSTAGGSVKPEHIKLMTNEKATNAKMLASLDWLVENTEEGDQCIFYFSGHGDIETLTTQQLGFLLSWDSPAQSYMAGAFPLYYLELIINTLTIDKKAKVIIVTDACRAGKLAGSAFSGSKYTSVNLARQFSNEVKILSCQVDEYSLEGEKWGGGRGVFSYYLIDGLYGLADNNSDHKINLLEIERYLEDHVPNEVAPASQIPMTIGSKSQTISFVDNDLLEKIKLRKSGAIDDLAIVNKNLMTEDELVNNLFGRGKELFTEFKNKLNQKIELNALDSIYDLMMAEKPLVYLNKLINREYATALQDEIQQALNALLNSDPYESNTFFFDPTKYQEYPNYIQRSIELLKPDHYSIKTLIAKKYFFEAYNVTRLLSESDEYNKPKRDSLREVANNYLNKAIALQPDASYLYYGKCFVYSHRTPTKIDSVLFYSKKASELSPQWLLPYIGIVTEYMYILNDLSKAEEWLLKAQKINPESYVIAEYLTWLYQTLGNPEKALEMSMKMVELKPDLFNGYGNVGGAYFQKHNYLEAEKWYLKALALNDDPTIFVPQYYAYVLMATKRHEEGASYFEKYLNNKNSPYWMNARYNLWFGIGLINFTEKYEQAEKLISASQSNQHIPSGIAECLTWRAKAKIEQNKWDEARGLLNQALAYEPQFVNAFILAYSLMGELEWQAGNLQKAEKYFKKGMDYLGSNFFKEEALYRYGYFLMSQNRDDEAKEKFEIANWMTNNFGYLGDFGLALIHAKKDDNQLALYYLEKSINNFYPKKNKILNEPFLEKFKTSEKFKELIKNNFD